MLKRALTGIFIFFFVFGQAQTPATINDLLGKMNSAKDSNKVKSLIDLGNYYLAKSLLDSNIYYLNKALEEAERCNYIYGKGRVLAGLGNMYRANGQYEKAIEFLLKSLEIRNKLKLPLEAAAVQEAIGRVYISLENPEKAIGYFNIAQKTYEDHKDSVRLVPLFSIFGDYHTTKKEYKTGLAYYKKTIDILSNWDAAKTYKISQKFLANFKATAKINYSFCLVELGRPGEAIEILEPLVEERKKIGGVAAINPLGYLGYAHLKAGNYKKSIENSEAALSIIKANADLKLFDESADLKRNIAEAHYALGNYKEAYLFYRSFKEVNDSLNNEKATKAITEIQTKYETEKKDQQILLLNKEKKTQQTVLAMAIGAVIITLAMLAFALRSRKLQQKLFRQKEELMTKEKEIEKKALEQKMTGLEQMALRAQMNPHFIFNSLNSVQHFVMNHDVEGVNKYLGAFAHLIRQTLNNSGKQLISLNEEIKYLDTYLALEKMKSNNRFNYKIEATDDINTNATFIPGMILQPFVENSIKHGVAHKTSDEGFINIRISKNGKLVCRIDDNGIGRQKAAEIKTAANAEYESRGMDITMHRIETINKMYNASASVQVTDLLDATGNTSGTSVTVELPFDME